MAWAKEKMRHTGELITAAIWNTEIVNNQILVGESGPELIRPFSFQEPEVVGCQFCGQLNKVDMDKLYRGCGACGGMFSIEQFETKGKSVTEFGNIGVNSTHGTPVDSTYWLVGVAAHDIMKGDLVSF